MKSNLKLNVLLLFLWGVVAPSATVSHAAETNSAVKASATTASELANQVATSYGGMAKIKEMQNRGTRSHGFLKNVSTISSSTNVFECESVSKGDKIRIEMEFLGQPKIEAFDGNIGWSRSGQWVKKSDPKTVERISDELTHGLSCLSKLDDLTYKLELLAPRNLNGRLCDVLKLTPPNGKWTLLYIDPINRLIRKTEYEGFDSEQGVQAIKSTEYSDYRDILGLPTPFKIDELVAGKKSQEVILDGVTIDDTINNKMFEMPEESHYSRLDSGAVTLPFEYVGNEILVTVRINNGQDVKFVLDTGASQTVIDKTTAQSIGPITTHTFSVTALSKALPLSYTTLDKIQIGDLNLEGVPALVTDLSTLTTALGQRPAGLIGASILERFLVTIDFQDKKIILADPKNVSVPDGAIVVPTSPVFAATGLIVNGVLDGKPMNFFVDTGAAFNLLPFGFAQTFKLGAPIATGQLNGLEGQQTVVGSIKLNSLKLGSLNIANPVFNIRPEKGNIVTNGLDSLAGIGLLGNPTWSKTRLGIDYRNDRLIIEEPSDRAKLDRYLAQIEETDRNYLKNKNSDLAADDYEKLMSGARGDGLQAAEALAMARLAALYEDRFISLKENRWLEMSATEFEKSAKLAAASKNKIIEGQILAQWAMLCLNFPRNNTDLISAQNLLKRALNRAPMDASIYAALGSAMLKTSKTPSMGIKFIDRALLLDPADWTALNEKFKVAENDKKIADMKLIFDQISHYYPEFPQLKELMSRLAKASKTSSGIAKNNKNIAPNKSINRVEQSSNTESNNQATVFPTKFGSGTSKTKALNDGGPNSVRK